ncbi:hypothetical protein VNO77_03804 [Canavalia gladiata]|uniref:Uncharacterized protein n=1 Tax=Canavalia gladiata TaxID=3824 RepID=A0AAN9MW79_CANGL
MDVLICLPCPFVNRVPTSTPYAPKVINLEIDVSLYLGFHGCFHDSRARIGLIYGVVPPCDHVKATLASPTVLAMLLVLDVMIILHGASLVCHPVSLEHPFTVFWALRRLGETFVRTGPL